jgi:hypothetical protein
LFLSNFLSILDQGPIEFHTSDVYQIQRQFRVALSHLINKTTTERGKNETNDTQIGHFYLRSRFVFVGDGSGRGQEAEHPCDLG